MIPFFCFSQTYIGGDSNIVITVGHDGDLKHLPSRECGENANCQNDSYTKEIGNFLRKELKAYYIYNNVHRSRVDCNRVPDIAYDNAEAAVVYHNYHELIEETLTRLEYNKIIYLDIHGYVSSKNEIWIGWDGEIDYVLCDFMEEEG